MSRFFLVCLFQFFILSSIAQIGGRYAFEFMNVPAHARLAALGGVNISLTDRDINFVSSNPSLLSDTLSGWGSASYQAYVADIGHSSLTYAHTFRKLGLMAFSLQHMSYGTITGYDPSGMATGDYTSGETVLMMSKSHKIRHFRLGVSAKAVFSSLAGYRASAAMLDVGGVFIHPDQDWTIGLVIRNLGFLFSEYSNTSQSPLPFDVQLGTTFKPEHMPVRVSITAYRLADADPVYYNPADGNEEPGALDKVLRRFNFGAELLVHRNFNILFGYNYRIHQELKLEEGGGGAGVSLGFSGRIKSFEFTFARSGYVAGAGAYTFTLASDIKSMLTRR